MGAKGNMAIGQSGGPTCVINSSLAGVIHEAIKHNEIGEILGMHRGIRGLLADEFYDLRRQPSDLIAGLRRTPGAALGTARYKVKPADYERVLAVIRKRNIRYLHYIGGNDSADTSFQLHKMASQAGYELHLVAVPKTVDNDLALTDHCPGYPSAARFVALGVRDTGRDTESMAAESPIKLVEVMGRNAGWLTAAAALAREEPGDAPHLVYVPECPVAIDQVLADIKRCYDEYGTVVIAVSEGAEEAPGKTMGEAFAPKDIDAFGHRRKGGVTEFLAEVISAKLGFKARVDKPNYLQRSFMLATSPVDLREAYRVGQQAVREALRGRDQGLIVLHRDLGPKYHCSLGVADLDKVANHERKLPREYMNAVGNYPTEAFLAYARPLLGADLIPYVRLAKPFA
jgi:ATP-dependent phosphofructokinase / diphosphate-dependent phosphofructokinase